MVSLIVPCYNSENYIDRCLKSILNQTNKDIELILVNDGSTDDSEKIIDEYSEALSEKLTSFKYIKQENKGVGAACDRAFKHVTGKYLILLDSDDYLFPEAIEKLSIFLESNSEFSMVRSNGYYVHESNLDQPTGFLEVNPDMKEKQDIFLDLFRGTTYVWPGTYMIRMDILEQQYPDRNILPSRSGQNLQFLLAGSYKKKSGFIDEPLMAYTVRENSLSHFSGENSFQKEVNAMKEYRKIREYLIPRIVADNEKNVLRAELDDIYLRVYFQLACKYKQNGYAAKYIKLLIKQNKCDLNTLIDYCLLRYPAFVPFLKLLRRIKSFTNQ